MHLVVYIGYLYKGRSQWNSKSRLRSPAHSVCSKGMLRTITVQRMHSFHCCREKLFNVLMSVARA